MSLIDTLDRIVALTPAEKEDVLDVLDGGAILNQTLSQASRQWLMLYILKRKGVIRSLPTGEKPTRDFHPVKIKGKPLSETIIEDRR